MRPSEFFPIERQNSHDPRGRARGDPVRLALAPPAARAADRDDPRHRRLQLPRARATYSRPTRSAQAPRCSGSFGELRHRRSGRRPPGRTGARQLEGAAARHARVRRSAARPRPAGRRSSSRQRSCSSRGLLHALDGQQPVADPASVTGRVPGTRARLWLFAFAGLTPVGRLVAGWLADVGGTELAFSVTGVVCVVNRSWLRSIARFRAAPQPA